MAVSVSGVLGFKEAFSRKLPLIDAFAAARTLSSPVVAVEWLASVLVTPLPLETYSGSESQ